MLMGKAGLGPCPVANLMGKTGLGPCPVANFDVIDIGFGF
jgi:hypothetical protein